MDSDHQRIGARSLTLHEAIADKLFQDPSLLGVAREHLDRWKKQTGAPATTFIEWEEILSRPVEEIVALLVDRGERMTACASPRHSVAF